MLFICEKRVDIEFLKLMGIVSGNQKVFLVGSNLGLAKVNIDEPFNDIHAVH